MSSDRIPSRKAVKPPRKPRPSFPLSAHRNGQWFTTRRIAGRKEFFYFGRWEDDPKGDLAEAAFDAVKDDLNNGREPTPVVGAVVGDVTIGFVVARFLDVEEQRYKDDEIDERHFDDIRRAVLHYLLKTIPLHTPAADIAGLIPGQKTRWLDQFRSALSNRVGVYRFNKSISIVRRMLRWANRTSKILAVPLHDDDALRRKPKKVVKREKREKEERNGLPIFEPAQCLQLIGLAAAMDESSPLLAIVLLGLNAGMGQSHISELPDDPKIIDTTTRRVQWVRPKTEELFQFVMWPITAAVIERYRKHRPMPKPGSGAEGLLFVTKYGHPWVQTFVKVEADGATGNINPDDAIAKEFRKLELAIGCKRAGRGFYGLRRTFSTIANDIADKDAVLRIMGQELRGMDPHYIRRIPWERIETITEYVRHRIVNPLTVEASDPSPARVLPPVVELVEQPSRRDLAAS